MAALSEDAIFDVARQIRSEAARDAYLDQVCDGNQELRGRVGELLAAHEAADSRLDGPVLRATAEHAASIPLEKPGTQIGPYKLLQEIGEGGMGVVFMAEQRVPVKRRVALKIIKPGLDTRQVVARFEAERQALALLDHPNIAKVLDAGSTESGRPYFVMELVNGVPITEYCDEHQLTLTERLDLFTRVCQAVQHSHQKGIIHRDLKPSNVLIAEYDDQVVPKIIDFGVAKATNQTLTEKTMFTQYGQIVGTLEYMSPEQAKRNQLDIDTRSDIYSLGVMLYELLTGDTPHDRQRLQSSAFDEMLRIIREEEPPRPSTRLRTSPTLQAVASKRNIAPTRLKGLVRGELDWIVMRSLEKDRNRRYAAASALADDLTRYLTGEAVSACPPTLSYRFTKFVNRYRTTIASVAILLAILSVGLVGTTWLAIQAIRARAEVTALLEQLKDEIMRKSLICAMNGDEAGMKQAYSQADALGVSTSWKHRLHGLLYISKGQFAAAVDELARALQFDPDDVLASFLHSRAKSYLTCSLEEIAANHFRWRDCTPDSPEAKLLLETAYLYSGEAMKAVDGATEYLRQYNNGVGRRFRAEAYLQLASEHSSGLSPTSSESPTSIDFLKNAERDFIVVQELMPDSAMMYFTGIRVHTLGYQLEDEAGNEYEKSRHREEGIQLCNRITDMEFPMVHGVAAIFYDAIGDYRRANQAWKVARAKGAVGYWLADYASFLSNHRDQFEGDFLQVLVELEDGDVWCKCHRIMLGLDVDGLVAEPVREMEKLAKRNMAPGARAWPIRMLFLLGRKDLAETLAAETIEQTKGESLAVISTEFECLRGRKSADWLLAQHFENPGDWFYAQLGAGLRLIGDGNRTAGIDTLAAIERQPYGGPFRDFVVALLNRLRSDEAWPHLDRAGE